MILCKYIYVLSQIGKTSHDFQARKATFSTFMRRSCQRHPFTHHLVVSIFVETTERAQDVILQKKYYEAHTNSISHRAQQNGLFWPCKIPNSCFHRDWFRMHYPQLSCCHIFICNVFWEMTYDGGVRMLVSLSKKFSSFNPLLCVHKIIHKIYL